MTTQHSYLRLALTGFIVLDICAVSLAGNMVENGAFDGPAGPEGMPVGWSVSGDKSAAIYDADAKCVRFECVRLEKEVSLRQGNLALEPGRQYRLTCQVKTEAFDGIGGVTVINQGWTWSCAYLRPDAATTEWTKLEKVFTPEPSSNGKYQVVFFSLKATGKIFAKDIRIEPVEEAAAGAPQGE